MRFEAVHKMINNARQLNEDEAWLDAIDPEVKDEIIRLNTQDQLFDRGIDSKERELGDYSAVSVSVYGKPAGHIRLYDTGNFYESFSISVDSSGLTIFADDVSIYDEPLTNVWGIDIIGLTVDSANSLKEWILPNYLRYVRAKLLP